MSNLNLMCGIPGSGKSTWLKNNHLYDYIVSRDEIRFSLLKEGEEYFSHENQVWYNFVNMINYYGSKKDKDVWIDQTNLHFPSRKKVLSAIKTNYYDTINAYYIDCPLAEAIKRNEERTGWAKVPGGTISRIYNSFEIPKLGEGFDNIYKIDYKTGEVINNEK